MVASFGKLLPKSYLDNFGLCVNVHPSALPKWRGANPIQSALLSSEDETAKVSIQTIATKFDRGTIIHQSDEVSILNKVILNWSIYTQIIGRAFKFRDTLSSQLHFLQKMAYISNSLGYRYADFARDEKIKLIDVHRETNYFYGRVWLPKTISRLIEESLASMRPVGVNPNLGEAVICQYIHGKEADMKWYRAQIVNKFDSIYRVVFVDYGSAAEYHADVFHEHARVPTEELIKKKISCVPFKDKNDYSAKVGMKSILDDIVRNHRGCWRFLPSKEHVMERFDANFVMLGRIYVKIEGKNIRSVVLK